MTNLLTSPMTDHMTNLMTDLITDPLSDPISDTMTSWPFPCLTKFFEQFLTLAMFVYLFITRKFNTSIFSNTIQWYISATLVLLSRLTRIVPPESWAFMARVDKGGATAGKYENVTKNTFRKKWKFKTLLYTNMNFINIKTLKSGNIKLNFTFCPKIWKQKVHMMEH